MARLTLLAGALAAVAACPALAQEPSPASVVHSTSSLGVPLPQDQGPWVIGDVLFRGHSRVSEYTLRNRVRARQGMLYTPSDLSNDVSELSRVAGVSAARVELYGMPEEPVPDNYVGISVSSMSVRLVYRIEEKDLQLPGMSKPKEEGAAPAAAAKKEEEPKHAPAPLSGAVLTPTAYRGVNQHNRPGLGLDFNTSYFIGRLYGKNTVSNKRTNFIDRIGVWFVSVNGKMQIQSETELRPAVAAGVRGVFTYRDAPQPSLQTPTFTAQVSGDTTRALSEGYVVASKGFRKKVYASAGFAQGDAGDRFALLTEFLSPEFLHFGPHPNGTAQSRSTLFGSVMYLHKPHLPLAVEFIKPNGMFLSPYLINLKIGTFLKLNFDLAYLKFNGGWDLLGLFQFRYTYFPRPEPRRK